MVENGMANTSFESSTDLDELFTSLSIAQGIMGAAKKDKENPYFKSSYADLESCWEAIRKPFSEAGLSVVQIPMPGKMSESLKTVKVKTILAHSSGQWIANTVELIPTKVDPQGMGSAMTYARRYGLMAIAGIAPEDDDGNAASQPKKQETQSNDSAKMNAGKGRKLVTDGQLKRLRAIASAANWPNESVKNAIKEMFNLDSSKKLNMLQYDELCKFIEASPMAEEEPDFDKPL